MKYLVLLFLLSAWLFAAPVTLQNATSTHSQSGYSVASSIDGAIDAYGWAVSAIHSNHTAVWETTSNINASQIQFTMYQYHPYHLIGRFLFSVTSDTRTTFADGLLDGGDVTANWTALINPTITLPSGMSYTTLGDNSILISGAVPVTGVYSVTYSLPIANITGIRLDVLTHSSLPSNGPGMASNGNLVLSELVVDATNVPEPSSFVLLAFFMICVYSFKK
ncbi:MAG: hypothetical protein HUU50_10710 [Candidatus Brocadiae bacterium]|nr:hypothetical protein [Candidatus Brocadiia bacterium]